MTIRDTNLRYGFISMANHWISAALMVALLFLGWFMEDIGGPATEIQLTKLHASIGMSLLLLTLMRLGWRNGNASPTPPTGMPHWQIKIAKYLKYGLYVTLIALPITGWVMFNADGHSLTPFGLFSLPDIVPKNGNLSEFIEEIHEFLVALFLFLASVHILAAVKHHLWDKDDVLNRMMPNK